MSNKRSYHDWGYTKVSDDVFVQYQLKKDDIIVTRTASLGLNTIISKDLNAVYNNGLIRLSINKEKIIPLLVYRQFQTTDFENYISKIEGETSVRPNMKINYLLQYNFSIISKEKQEELANILRPIWERQEQLKEENEKLSQLRDTLLPKLMSGEIDVSNVDISALTSSDKLSFRCRSPPKNISYRFSCYFPLNSVICDIFIRQIVEFFAYFCTFSALFTGYNFISKHSLCCVNQIERIQT